MPVAARMAMRVGLVFSLVISGLVVLVFFGAIAHATGHTGGGGGNGGGDGSGNPLDIAKGDVTPSPFATSTIPAEYLSLYIQDAKACPGLSWTVVAAVGMRESTHGTDPNSKVPNSAGAVGPMQFEPTTFQEYYKPTDANAPPWQQAILLPQYAIPASVAMLCADGGAGGKNIKQALYIYNNGHLNGYSPDNPYVTYVLDYAQRYSGPPADAAGSNIVGAPTPQAAAAVAWAIKQIGIPYEWGGDGPQQGYTGFDCSGLTQFAYASTGVSIPRTAQPQFYATKQISTDQLMPGDLLFWGTASNIHHVGMYVGGGLMVDAPHTGALVREERWATFENDFFGATRPT